MPYPLIITPFTSIPGSDRQEQCFVHIEGYRFRVIKYHNGYLSAWLAPGTPGSIERPISHPRTTSMMVLLDGSLTFLLRAKAGLIKTPRRN